jgi:protein TonB
MHRMFAVLGLLALPLSAATFEARSPHHALSIERNVRANGEIAFEVRVTELDSNRVLLNATLSGPRNRQLASQVSGDPHVAVDITDKDDDTLSAFVQIDSQTETVDTFSAHWQLVPRKRLQTAGALRVGGDVKAPMIRHRVEPVYPEAARRNKTQGIVILEAVIDASGNVRDVSVLSRAPDGLSEAAADAVKQWKFAPGTVNGQPVDVIYNVTISFSLNKDKIPFPGEG